MNRSDLATDLAHHISGLSQRDADHVVKLLQDSISRALVQGQRIEIRGFGSFSANWRAARVGRNPRNGDSVQVPAKRVAHFKPGKALREAVDASVPKPAAAAPKATRSATSKTKTTAAKTSVTKASAATRKKNSSTSS